MLNRCFNIATLLSLMVLVFLLLLWPRSFFYCDAWWVKNSPPWLPRLTLKAFLTGSQSSEFAVCYSMQGCIFSNQLKCGHLEGKLRSAQFQKPEQNFVWIPKRFSVTWVIPYWCLVLIAAIFPSGWLLRERRKNGKPIAFRYGVRHFFYASTIASLMLTGYLQLGFAGALIAIEASLAFILAIYLLKTARQAAAPTKYILSIAGSASSIGALGLAWFYVNRCNHCL